MKKYAIYLRKSRMDIEAEKTGEGETLKRHEHTLLQLANKLRLIIEEEDIYREIVSGETIASRPQMQKLLRNIEQQKYAGVLVVEVERLARGDTMDQGLVTQVFKYSNTKIITPNKTFEMDKESDEEYLEFGLFMSRREYKTINRRLQNGRIMSVIEGKYVGNVSPYGYEKTKLQKEKGFTLVENKEESEIIKIVFQMYTDNNYSYNRIATELNKMGYQPRSAKKWGSQTIKEILSNPVYIGKIRWNARKEVKKMVNGEIRRSRPRNCGDDVMITDGLHSPIIDMEIWEKTQERKKMHSHKTTFDKSLKNPLAGIIVCGVCGKKMYRRPYTKANKDASLICTNKGCTNISSKFYIVEEQAIKCIQDWLKGYSANIEDMKLSRKESIERLKKSIENLEKKFEVIEMKLDRLCDFFEEGIYTKETYFDRSKKIAREMETVAKNLKEKKNELANIESVVKDDKEVVEQLSNAMDIYYTDISIEEKNVLLKRAIEKIEYVKEEKAIRKDSNPYNFTLKLYPKLWKVKFD